MTPEEVVRAVLAAPSWNARVAVIRRIPEEFGEAHRARVYSLIAQAAYVPHLKPDFAYVHWRPEYELPVVEAAYDAARQGTAGFTNVSATDLADTIRAAPQALLAFRLIVGLLTNEFAGSCKLVATARGVSSVSKGRIVSIEGGRAVKAGEAEICAATIEDLMAGTLFPAPPGGSVRPKQVKPDTAGGWTTVRTLATDGVPYATFLHQRLYGGSFGQLLNATSKERGDLLEDPVEDLFMGAGVPYVRTGAHNQAEIETRFGLTVRPAPDYVVFEAATDNLRAMLEVKGANDGGTARDKAARFRTLRTESERLGGVPVFGILAGLGWDRTNDALGPVIRATDGRTFTPETLHEMLDVEPFPALRGQAP